MRTAWRHFLRTRAPRYTSFPSAAHFDQSVTQHDYATRLDEVPLYEPLSIYVHVPFCRRLCWYCGCNMRVENNYGRVRAYVDALVDEFRLVGARLNGRGRPSSLHFGGGTPNFLMVDDLAEILAAIECELGLTDDARLDIELDPRLINDDYVYRLAGLGFSRMSIGVQDFDPQVQAAINRVQSFDTVEAAVGAVRAAGVADLSFDLLYGLPRQTELGFRDTVEKSIALAPDRVSVFGYAHLPSALPRQRQIRDEELPSDDLRAVLAETADDLLIDAGYVRIGFDHYAKPDNPLGVAARAGRLKRNFQGFTDDVANYVIGFGPSAVGSLAGLYAQNEKEVGKYVLRVMRGELPIVRGLMRTPREAVIARAINELLCQSETDVATLLGGAAPHEANRVCRALEEFEAAGVIEWRDNWVRLQDDAHLLARIVASAFDPYAASSPVFAKAV